MEASEIARITRKIRELFADEHGPFRPFALFEEELNRILVLVKDCSVTKERINALLTVFEDNYPEGSRIYVGFAIEGARQFCSENGLPAEGEIRLAAVLDALNATCPKHTSFVNEHLRPLLAEFCLNTITLPHHVF